MCTLRLYCVTVLFVLLAFSVNSSDAQASCDSIRCTSKVSSIYATGQANDWKIFIEPNEDSLSSLNCNAVGEKYLTLYHSHGNYSEILAMVNLALLANKTVNMRIVENTDDCTIDYVMLYSGQYSSRYKGQSFF